ncbi:3-dehydroquinate synthase [Cutibacterium acnes JCM 18909]|nr:3-dehydroquinate synthase [Cutibacterium acnes JCM 18909]
MCDTDLLTTLPAREVRSGLAEIVKCGFIGDPVILDVISNHPRLALDVTSQTFVEVLTRAITVKAGVVSADPHERTSSREEVGRERLNYGHTLAHAIEVHKHFTWRHGEADAVGMVFAAELSHRYLDYPMRSLRAPALSCLGSDCLLPVTRLSGQICARR